MHDGDTEIEFREFDHGTPAYDQACQLRHAMLRVPLGLDLYAEDLSGECNDRHFGLWQGPRLLACLVISPKAQGRVKLRQMCVSQQTQGQGLGRRLIEATELTLRASEIDRIELAARLEARGFYEKLGYRQVGDVFTEVTIDHVRMGKQL